AWGLTADVPLGDLPIDAFAGGVDNIDFGRVLSRIIPIFKKFNSSIVRDVSFQLKQTPYTNGKYDFSDTSGFAPQDQAMLPQPDVSKPANSSLPLAFGFAARPGDLPKFRGSYVD